VEETPDTVITLTDGKKVICKESRHEVKNLVKLTRQDYFREILNLDTLQKASE
jgi:flagellar protein FlbD